MDLDALIGSGLDDRSAKGIAAAIGRMVSSGELVTGTRLPTVRELSRSLGVSPTTVSEAWQSLAAVGAIEPRGRQGTYVSKPVGLGSPRRYRRVTEGPGHFDLDLSSGTPDPDLLPDLGPIVASVSRQSLTSSYLDEPVLPPLAERLAALWPFVPEALTVVDGAMDALDRVAQVVVRLGERVVVEHPTFPPLLDLLERLGAEVIGVEVDDEGLVIDGMERALARHPRAVFLQPRAHNPAGIALTRTRAAALAKLLATSGAVVIEDDHSGDIANEPLVSLGSHLPHRTVHIRSFSKSHGPDLRLAAVGGAGEIITAVSNRRLLGPGWSSRILQAVLLAMLDDPATIDTVAAARAEYQRRRRLVVDQLDASGVGTTGRDGINVWVRVADERSALITLAAQSIGAAPGEPFLVHDDVGHLRVTLSPLDGTDADIERVVARLADAARSAALSKGQR
jgi:DNA-binding transcriptional MocR family regulator